MIYQAESVTLTRSGSTVLWRPGFCQELSTSYLSILDRQGIKFLPGTTNSVANDTTISKKKVVYIVFCLRILSRLTPSILETSQWQWYRWWGNMAKNAVPAAIFVHQTNFDGWVPNIHSMLFSALLTAPLPRHNYTVNINLNLFSGFYCCWSKNIL